MLEERFFQTIDQFFGSKKPSKIVLSFSGGVDSLALLLLLRKWSIKNNVTIYSIHVDHRLRQESSVEAAEIAKFCKEQKINHASLTWIHEGISSGIQEKARDARKVLIQEYCHENSIKYIFTAHHFNDQIEQLLISLTQGAGIYSFLMPDIIEKNGIIYYKPLLNFDKSELINYVESENFSWWEDSSNNEDKYLRNKIRKLAISLSNISDKQRLQTSISNIKRAASGLNAIKYQLLEENVENSELGYSKLNLATFYKIPEEIRFSILRHIIIRVGRRKTDIRLDSIKKIDDALLHKRERTLGGCFITYSEEKAVFIREFRKYEPSPITSRHGIWDNRFEVSNNIGLVRRLSLSELNKMIKTDNQILNFDTSLTKLQQKHVLHSLPALFLLEKLVLIPHIYNHSISVLDHEINFKYLEI